STVSSRASLEDLEKHLQLIYLYFTAPKKDTLTFQNWKNEITKRYFGVITGSVSTKTDMTNDIATFLNFESYKSPHNPISPQQFYQTQYLSYEHAMESYRSIFGNASQFTITIKGNYKKKEVLPLLQKYLGNLTSNADASCPNNKSDVK